MVIPKFRDPLPEDRLSERERDERIRVLDLFSMKLKKERKTADLDHGIAIRQLLVYVGKRLELLDIENRHARCLQRFDFLLGHSTKPVPQSLLGVATGTTLDLGLKDTIRIIRSHEGRTESLIAEIALLAPEIKRVLDQRQAVDKDNFVLRPSSCLPEITTVNQPEPSKFENAPELMKPELSNSGKPQTDIASEAQAAGDQNAKENDQVDPSPREKFLDKDRFNSSNGQALKLTRNSELSDEYLRKEFLESKKASIRTSIKLRLRNFMADRLMNLKYLTVRQRVAVVLWFGYEMGDTEICALMRCASKTVYDHRKDAIARMRNDHSLDHLLKNYKRKKRRSDKEEDARGSESRLYGVDSNSDESDSPDLD